MQSCTNQTANSSNQSKPNLYRVSGWKPPDDSEARGSVVETVKILVPLTDNEFKKHLRRFKDEYPSGQLRSVDNFIDYLKEEQGIKCMRVENNGYYDITG